MFRPCNLIPLFLLAHLWLTNAADPQFPKLSDMFSMFYQAEVQLTDLTKQQVAFINEYYDQSQSRGRADMLALGNRVSFYYSDMTTQIIKANSTACLVSPEDESEYYEYEIFYGWLHKNPLVIGPSAALWFAEDKENTPVYKGTEIVRGINCSKFELYIKNEQNDVTYLYYFSVPEWTTPYQDEDFKTVPVKILITGSSNRDVAGKSFELINQEIVYSYFRPSIKDWQSFQPDLGLGCFGKKSEFAMPNISEEFRFAAEFYDIYGATQHPDSNIDFYRVWYNNRTQMARVDSYTKMITKSELYDFNNGVTYRIKGGACQILALRSKYFITTDADKLTGYAKKSAKEVLLLTGDFYDMGERYMRGIKCRVFENVKFDATFFNIKFSKIVTTVYFSTDYVEMVNEADDNTFAPVYMMFTGYDKPDNLAFQYQLNVFAYDDAIGTSIYDSFRIEDCFPLSQNKSYFVLVLPVGAENAALLEQHNDIFIAVLKSQIVVHANISDVRVPFIKADYDVSGVYVTGLMLDRPPALSQFWLEYVGESKSSDLMHIEADAKTQEACATACVNKEAFTCKGFHFCKICYLNEEDIGEPAINTATLGSCEVYVRGEINPKSKEDYLAKALQNLKAAVDSQKLKADVRLSLEKVIEVIPTEILIGGGPFDNFRQEQPYSLIYNGYQLPPSTDSETSVEAVDVDSLNECYTNCKSEKSIMCSSFSYCSMEKSKLCILSSTFIANNAESLKNIAPNTACNVYSLKYLEYFDPYPGKLSLIPGKKNYEKIKSTEECAMKCRTEKDFLCRGFEYCTSAKSCMLHAKHILDLNDGETTQKSKIKCIHYAAKYTADYLDLGDTLIDDDSNQKTDIGVEACARLCSEGTKSCVSFNYCPPTSPSTLQGSYCSLLTTTLTSKGVKLVNKPKCHHYTKRSAVEDWAIPKPLKTKGGYSSKAFVGLIIGMLFFGLVVGVLLFVSYSFYRSRQSGDGMSVRFVK